MKAKSLSKNILENTIKSWGLHCSKCEKYRWTKHDANAMLLLQIAVREMQHEAYEKRKQEKANQRTEEETEYSSGVVQPRLGDEQEA